jgi:hypothetical protein
VGWVPAVDPVRQRSFYCVDGNTGEFTEGLDVTLITELPAKSAATSTSGARIAPQANSTQPLTVSRVAMGQTGSVEIDFHLGAQAHTTLIVVDVRGRRVRTLLEGTLSSGDHRRRWDARDGEGLLVASGIYFVVLKAHGMIANGKILMLR